MTNCPNCGAPYALNSRVCEYCGTARESAQEQEQHDNIDPCTGVYIRHEFSGLRGYIDPSDPSQQIACGVQAIANAAQRAQCNNITFGLVNGNVIVNSTIGVNSHVSVNAGSGAVMFMGTVNGAKNIQATHEILTQKPKSGKAKQADELTEAEARLKLAAFLLLPLVFAVLGYFGLRIQNELVQCFCNLAFICGLCLFAFNCVACGLAYACAFFEANFEADAK